MQKLLTPGKLLVLLLIFSVFVRFWRLDAPRGYVFDEVYHGFTAKLYALQRYEAWVWWTSPPEGVAYEWTHPPLAKVIMSWSILLLGGPGELPTKIASPEIEANFTEDERKIENQSDRILSANSFGLRASGALFGVLCTLGLYMLANSWFRNRWVGLLTGLLFCVDLLPLVQSRTAMNDIYTVTFLVWGLYFFTRRKEGVSLKNAEIKLPHHLVNYQLAWWNWLTAGALVGCAIASKWTSLFGLGLVAVYHIFTLVFCYFYLRHNLQTARELAKPLVFFMKMFTEGLKGIVCFGLLPFVIYLLAYWQMFTLPIPDYGGNLVSKFLDDYPRNVLNAEENLARLENELRAGKFEYKSAEELEKEKAKQEADLSLLRRERMIFGPMYAYNPELAQRFYIWWGVQKQMWWYHTNLVATHDYTSQWWSWPLMYRPVWFYVDYCGETTVDPKCQSRLAKYADSLWSRVFPYKIELKQITDPDNPELVEVVEDPVQSLIADVYTMGNPIMYWGIFPLLAYFVFRFFSGYRWWFSTILIFAIVLFTRYGFVFNSERENAGLLEQMGRVFLTTFPSLLLFAMLVVALVVVAATIEKLWKTAPEEKHLNLVLPLTLALLCFFTFWLPWAKSPRIMFYYHFLPPMTFMYVFLAGVIYNLMKYSVEMKRYMQVYLVLIILAFIYFYPHVTAMYMPEVIRTKYWWFPTWR
jgi:dolichyl-phosphate-mannose--protein O-mannosyl transferase